MMEFIFSTVKFLVMNHFNQNPIFSTIRYWLVSHPKIHNFSWKQDETPASSPRFLTFTVLSYLLLTFLVSHINLPSIQPRLLKFLGAIHNMILLILSFIMAFGCALSVVFCAPNLEYIVCFPKNTPQTGPLFFWAYIFYLSKILEFMDTLLIILNKSTKRLTFLHVYHHAMVAITSYKSLHTSQSMFPGVLLANTSVHVMMYFYYLMCTLGMRPKWKKFVTDCQIVQFFSSYGILALIFYHHCTGFGCSGMWAWCFDTVFITSLLVMFLDFHSKNYSMSTRGSKDI